MTMGRPRPEEMVRRATFPTFARHDVSRLWYDRPHRKPVRAQAATAWCTGGIPGEGKKWEVLLRGMPHIIPSLQHEGRIRAEALRAVPGRTS